MEQGFITRTLQEEQPVDPIPEIQEEGTPSTTTTQQQPKQPSTEETDKKEAFNPKLDYSYYEAKGMSRGEWNRLQMSGGVDSEVKAFAEDPRSAWEGAMAIPTGYLDTVIDAVNFVSPFPDIPKLPKFQNEVMQTVRNFSGIIGPGGALGGAIKAKGAAFAASKSGRAGAFLRDPVVSWLGGTAAVGGGGALVDMVAETQGTDQTGIGTLKETFPRWTGWLPNNFTVMDGDSEDVIRLKNMGEGGILTVFADGLQGLGKFYSAKRGLKTAASYVPENELAGAYFAKNQKKPLETVDEVLDFSAGARAEDLEELGYYNTYKADIDEQFVFGRDNEMYDFQELGIRSADDGGIVTASVNAARIEGNIDTVYGRLANPVSEGALKYSIDTPGGVGQVMRGLSEQLTAAGRYGYNTNVGKYISADAIDTAGQRLTAALLEMDVNDMRRILGDWSNIDSSTKLNRLTKAGYEGVSNAISEYMKRFASMDTLKTYAYTATSFAGQISDIAQGMRYGEGSISYFRSQEQLLDRIEFLMNVKGQTDFTRNQIVRQTKAWDQITGKGNMLPADTKYAKTIQDQITGSIDQTLEAVEAIQRETKVTIDTLRNITKEKPLFLKPLALAYEMTDGDIRTMSALNRYLVQSTGTLSKAFLDGAPEIPSVVMQGFWQTLYNSVLNGLKTPIKAGVGNVTSLALKPLTQIGGAALTGNQPTLQRSLYAYSAIMETLSKGGNYAKQIWTRSASDPFVVSLRDITQYKTDEQMQLFKSVADAAEAEGNLGPAILYDIMENQKAMSEHPWLRFGNRSMGALDGWLQAINGSVQARMRAWDIVTEKGSKILDEKAANQLQREIYNQMFDSSGLMKDPQVLKETAEMTFSADNAVSTALTDLTKRVPLMRSFLMFTRSPVNSAKYGASFTPVKGFIDKLNKFSKPFDEMPTEAVKRLLVENGVDISKADLNMEYSKLRAEYRGRSAFGNMFVMMAVAGWMSGDITGSGLYDKQKQRLRREAGWKPTTAWGIDYSSIPAVGDWVRATVDILDNFSQMESFELEESLRVMGFILAANLTDRFSLQNMEQFQDVLGGNPGAIKRWVAGISMNYINKFNGQIVEFNKLMSPQLKAVEENLFEMMQNRSILKGQLPDQYTWIPPGGKARDESNPLARIWNAYSPFTVSSKPNEIQQYLIDIEYSKMPTAENGLFGQPYNKTQLAIIYKLMGEDEQFASELKSLMKEVPAKTFRQFYNTSQASNLDPKVSSILNLHTRVDRIVGQAKLRAERQLKGIEESRVKRYQQGYNERLLKEGRINDAKRFLQDTSKISH